MFPEEAWTFLSLAKRENYFTSGNVFIAIDFTNMGIRLRRNIDERHDFTGDHDTVSDEGKTVTDREN